MEMDMTNPTDGPPLSTDDEGEKLKKAEFERNMEEARIAQNLPEGAVPEQRPIASQTVDDPHSDTYKALREAGDPRAGAPAMDKAAYDRAGSAAQMKKAADSSTDNTRLYPGARAVIDREGHPDHGRSVAVNRVATWASFEEQMKGTSGIPEQMNAAIPEEYEVMTRDGRAEQLIVNADHLKVPTNQGDWGRSPI
jgi:hypothetical protein